jgi:exodeoxyribonuclease X
MTLAIIVDCESTDKQDRPDRLNEVIELAYVRLDATSSAAGHFLQRYKPKHPSTFGALATHHILPLELLDEPSNDTIKKPPGQYWIGHNVDFDWTLLGAPPVKRICTLALSRSLYPQLDSHSLSAMLYFILGANSETRERLRNAHSALADCYLCYDLLAHICEQLNVGHLDATGLEKLWLASEDARIPKIWSFGKFQDNPINAADRGYVNWFRKNCTDRPDYQYYLEAFRRAGLL